MEKSQRPKSKVAVSVAEEEEVGPSTLPSAQGLKREFESEMAGGIGQDQALPLDKDSVRLELERRVRDAKSQRELDSALSSLSKYVNDRLAEKAALQTLTIQNEEYARQREQELYKRAQERRRQLHNNLWAFALLVSGTSVAMLFDMHYGMMLAGAGAWLIVPGYVKQLVNAIKLKAKVEDESDN